MAKSFDELFAETAKARQNADLVQVVHNASSPTEAENCVKELEYPTNLVRETRLLAVMKRDYPNDFARAAFVISHEPDLWRYFDCTYDSHLPVQHDEIGTLAIKPDFLLPPLFWAYALYNSDGEKLFSFEDKSLGKETYHITVESGSQSIPAGLKIHVYGGILGEWAQFEYSLYSQTSLWAVERMRMWPIGACFWKNNPYDSDDSELACFRSAYPGGPVAGVPGDYTLVICEKLRRNTGSPDAKEQHNTFVVEGKYRLCSPWRKREQFSKEPGTLCSDPKKHAPPMMDARSPLSIEFHTAQSGQRIPEEVNARSLEDVVKSMLFGLPKNINGERTLKKLFGFKSPHMPCYNKNNFIPIIPFLSPTI
ncbi:MAG: hypothetical protein HYZ69_03385 [Candidatus Colwellbacteria bacterium]|nr:hypothetical protein [Candidatus Colwellbacteria bacterium]